MDSLAEEKVGLTDLVSGTESFADIGCRTEYNPSEVSLPRSAQSHPRAGANSTLGNLLDGKASTVLLIALDAWHKVAPDLQLFDIAKYIKRPGHKMLRG